MTYKNHTPSTRRNHWYWHFGKHLRARSVCACEGTWLSEPPNWPWMQTREGMNGHCGSKEEIGSREINPHRCSHKRHLPQLHRWHFSGWKKTRQTLNSFTLGQKHTHTQTRTPHAIIHPSLVPLAHSLSRSSSEMEKQLLCTFPISHSDFCKRMAVDFQHGRKGAADCYPCWCHCLKFGICMSLTSQAYVKYTNSLCLRRADSAVLIIPFLWMTPQRLTAAK